jgi:hypothetical protein
MHTLTQARTHTLKHTHTHTHTHTCTHKAELFYIDNNVTMAQRNLSVSDTYLFYNMVSLNSQNTIYQNTCTTAGQSTLNTKALLMTHTTDQHLLQKLQSLKHVRDSCIYDLTVVYRGWPLMTD